MDYELAKELNEAGLEGDFNIDTIVRHPDCADRPVECDNKAHSDSNCYTIAQCPPSLEELIEALGDDGSLDFNMNINWISYEDDYEPGETEWSATKYVGSVDEYKMPTTAYGQSLWEAVAWLWLELNKTNV